MWNNFIRQHQKRQLAIELVRREMRTTPIRHLTGLSDVQIRGLYHLVHQRPARAGRIHQASTLCRTRALHARLSVLAVLYRQIGGQGIMRRVSAEALIQAWDLFHELDQVWAGNPGVDGFDISDAWVIARDLCQQRACFSICKTCNLHFVVTEDSLVPPTCPFCANRKARWVRRKLINDDQDLL